MQTARSTERGGGRADVGSDSEADNAASDSGSSSEDEGEDEPASKGNKVRLEDFDDEEEYLVAGGTVEAAMTRKEWGSALLAETKEDDADVGESKEDKSKKAQEEKRAMYRESEKMMRERRCLIKPAPVVKRSVKDLLAKVEARASKVDQDAVATAPANEQADQATSAPQAPKSAESTAAPSKMQMDEDDDDDDDEIVIRGNTVPSTPLQLPRTIMRKPTDAGAAAGAAVASPPPAPKATLADASAVPSAASATHGKIKTPKKAIAPASKTAMQIMSPPSARKKRSELRNQLIKTARSRSEHLIAAERAGIKIKRDAPPNFSPEMNLEELPDPFPNLRMAFIVSTKYVGHKKGYVFHMGDRGLGYYNEEEEEEEEEEEGVFDGAAKIKKVKLVSNDPGHQCPSFVTFVCVDRLPLCGSFLCSVACGARIGMSAAAVLTRSDTMWQGWKILMKRCRSQPMRVSSVVSLRRRSPLMRKRRRPSKGPRNV